MRDSHAEHDFESWPRAHHLSPIDIILDRRVSSISPFSLPSQGHQHGHHGHQSHAHSHIHGHARHRSVHHDHDSTRPSTPSHLATSMTLAPSPPPLVEETKIRGRLTYLNGLALVLSLQIGSGIFSTPAIVLSKTLPSASTYAPLDPSDITTISSPNPTLALAIWLIAGLLASTGAASFSELGVAVPRNGGVQEYVRYCWGERIGCCAATTLICVVFPTASAMIARIAAGYVGRLMFGGGPGVSERGQMWAEKGIAFVSIALVTAVNCAGARTGARTANVFLFGKILALVIIIVGGFAFWTVHGSLENMSSSLTTATTSSWTSSAFSYITIPITAPANTANPFTPETTTASTWSMLGRLTDATLAATLTYQGWENLGYVAGELADAARTLPRVLYSAMAMVVALFLATNLAYFAVVPPAEMVSSDVIALVSLHFPLPLLP